MKSPRTPAFVLGIVLCCGFLAGSVAAQDEIPIETYDRHGDVVSVLSGHIHIPIDVVQRGSVVSIGGNVLIEGEVTGDVVVILGELENRGKIRGAVTGVLSEQRHRNSSVGRELVSVLGSVDLEATRVSRELISILGSFRRDTLSSPASINIGFGSWFPDLRSMIFWLRLLRLFSVFVLLILLAALVPERIQILGEEAPVRYAAAFFLGLLGYLGMLIALGLLTVTVIGVPLAILGFVVLKWMGIAGIFLAVGRRLGRVLNREMSLLGAVMLVFGLYVAISMAPTVLGIFGLVVSGMLSVLFFFVVQVPAVGLVLLTLAGTRTGRPAVTDSTPPPPPGPAGEPAVEAAGPPG
jgi:hypothetical protein